MEIKNNVSDLGDKAARGPPLAPAEVPTVEADDTATTRFR